MPYKYLPGTVIPDNGTGGALAVIRPMITAADGLTLGQISALTGLECSTIQNWIKRGFVPHPVRKKYHEHQLARILIISVMRDSVKIEDVGELLKLINGNIDDERDDTITESDLYECLCETLSKVDAGSSEAEQTSLIVSVISKYRVRDEKLMIKALLVMVNAYLAGRYRRDAELYFGQLREEAKR